MKGRCQFRISILRGNTATSVVVLRLAFLDTFQTATRNSILWLLQASVAAPSALQVSAGEGPEYPPSCFLFPVEFCEKLDAEWLGLQLRLRKSSVHKAD